VVPALHEEQLLVPEIMIMASHIAPTITDHAVVVSTPLDAIVRLEGAGRVRTVVLAGTYARDPVLAASLRELYPTVHIEREP
jgi:hypothetical protein